jgi:hypothetical protein
MTASSPVDSRRLAAYLSATGWIRKRDSTNGALWAFGGRRSLIAPRADLDPEDYQELAERALARLAEVENRKPAEVMRDLALTDRDTLLIRIDSPGIADGEMPLRYGSVAFDGARELFTAAALAEHAPRARFGSFRPPSVLDVVDTATFGQTYAGSYVISIRTRGVLQLSWLPDGPAALERRAVARVLLAASAAAEAPPTEEVAPSIERGVSYEMCSALAKLDPGGTNVTVELSAIWAEGLARPTKAPLPPVSLKDAQLSHIRQVRDYLAAFEPVETEIVGGLTDVHVDLGGITGRIKLEAYFEGRVRPVYVELEGDALERVRRLVGRASLRMAGRLEKESRSWVLAEPRLLSVDSID